MADPTPEEKSSTLSRKTDNRVKRGPKDAVALHALVASRQTAKMQNEEENSLDESLPTIGQLMRTTAQALQRLYREQLDHSPKRVTCHLVADKLVVWMEGSITGTEKLLAKFGDDQLQMVRSSIDRAIRQPIVSVIEQHLKVKVVTLMTDTCYRQECTGLLVLLSATPQVRLRSSVRD